MDELHVSNMIEAAGACLFVAGIVYLFHSAIDVRRGKRGHVHTSFNFQRWSFRSTYRGLMMIAVSILLLGGWHFLSVH
jgi:hypothetical protein